jgi:hypothetical protein
VNLSLWRHQLVRLLQNLVETTIGNKLRQNKARGAKAAAAYELATELVDLAADIYRQTLAMNSEKQSLGDQVDDVEVATVLCDVTQIVPELNATLEPPRKRSRLDEAGVNTSICSEMNTPLP